MKWYLTQEDYHGDVEFSRFEPEYFLNAKGYLEEYPEPHDVQAEIDSYKSTLIQRIFDQISAPEYFTDNPSANYILERENARSDLEAMLQADEVLDNLRREYNLEGKSREEIIKFVQQRAAQSLRDYNEKQKGENQSEKETQAQPQGEQEKLSPDSAES